MGVKPAKNLFPADGFIDRPGDSNPNQVYFEDGLLVIDTGRGLNVKGPILQNGTGISGAPSGAIGDLSGSYQTVTTKGTAGGYPDLNSQGVVPLGQLPNLAASYQAVSGLGQASGYAGLTASAQIAASVIPLLSATYQIVSLKDTANGYVGIGAGGKATVAPLQEVLSVSDLANVAGTFSAGHGMIFDGTNFKPSGKVFSATAYGVVGDNNNSTATANSTALDACIAAAAAAAATSEGVIVALDWTGVAYLNGGHKIYSRVAYIGNHGNRSKLANSRPANTNVYETASFSTLTQTRGYDYTVGEYEFVFANHIIDGNASNNSSGGCGIAIVGYGYVLDRLYIEANAQAGWWTEWASTAEPINSGTGSNHERAMAIGQIRLYNNNCNARPAANTRASEGRSALTTGQATLYGPGDSNCQSMHIGRGGVSVAGMGIMYGSMDFTAGSAGMFDFTIDRLTIWGNHQVGIDIIGSSLYCKYFHMEGGYVNIRCTQQGSGPKIMSGKLFNARPTAFTFTGDTHTSTSVTNASSTSNLNVGMWVTGSGIPTGTIITAISGSTLTLSQATTSTLTGTTISPWPTELAFIGAVGNYTDIRMQALDNANNAVQYCRIANTSTSALVHAYINLTGQATNSNDTVLLAAGVLPVRARELDISFDFFSGTPTITAGWIDGPFSNSPLGVSGSSGDSMYRLNYFGQPRTIQSATATASAGAASLEAQMGTITSESLTTAAGSDYSCVITNALCKTTSRIFVSVDNNTNTTEGIFVTRITPASGSFTVRVRNGHASSALNGSIKITFWIVN
jgi:hypothetical protein